MLMPSIIVIISIFLSLIWSNFGPLIMGQPQPPDATVTTLILHIARVFHS